MSMSARSAGGDSFASGNCSRISAVGISASGWKTLIGRSWTVPPGTEASRCTTLRVAIDTYITAFHDASSAGDWHKLVSVADTATQLGDYNCAVSQLGEKALYMAGIGTDDLTLPPGVAMHVRPAWGTRMDLEHTELAPVLKTSVISFPTYDVHSQRVFVPAAPLTVSTALGGDQLRLTCTYMNTTSNVLMFGDSVFSEQCFMGAYRTPVVPRATDGSKTGSLFECVN